jgi:hypothetical protein
VNDSNDQVRYDVGGWISGPCLSKPMNQPHGITSEEATSLLVLRRAWQGTYEINFTTGTWRASRNGSALAVITADTPEELRRLIYSDDMNKRQEARQVQAQAEGSPEAG